MSLSCVRVLEHRVEGDAVQTERLEQRWKLAVNIGYTTYEAHVVIPTWPHQVCGRDFSPVGEEEMGFVKQQPKPLFQEAKIMSTW